MQSYLHAHVYILAAASVFRLTMFVGGVSTTKCAVEHLLLVSMEVMLISRFGIKHEINHFFVYGFTFYDYRQIYRRMKPSLTYVHFWINLLLKLTIPNQ